MARLTRLSSLWDREWILHLERSTRFPGSLTEKGLS